MKRSAYVGGGRTAWSECGRCAETFLAGVARETNPAALARRIAAREAEARHAAEMEVLFTQQARTRAVQEAWDAARCAA